MNERFLNQKWITYDNKAIKNKDLSDDHLINIIGHLRIQGRSLSNLRNYLDLASSRGLTQKDLDRFQIPHVNKEGKRCLMDYDDNLKVKEII